MSFFAIEEEETFFEDEELEKELQSRLSAVVISDLEDSDYSEEETSFHAADEVEDGEKPFNLAENLRMLQSYSNVAFNFEELEEGGVPVSNPEAPESPAKITSQSLEVIETRQLDEPLINTFLSNETSSEAEKIQAEINKEKTKNDQLKLDREENAALKIQKLYRGFKTRTSKTGRMVRGHLESKKRIKFVEKAQQFEFEERRRVAEEIKKENELILAERIKKDEELKRKREQEEKDRIALERAEKAEKIWNERILLFAEKMRRRRDQRAAVIIQRTVRDFLRKRLQRRSGAALVIQRNYRDYCTRKRTQAAISIQTYWRKSRELKARRALEIKVNAVKTILTHRRQYRQLQEAHRAVWGEIELRKNNALIAAQIAEQQERVSQFKLNRSAKIIQRMWRQHVVTENKAAEILGEAKKFTQIESQKTIVLGKSGISVASPRADLPILGSSIRGKNSSSLVKNNNASEELLLESENTIVVKKIDEELLAELKRNLERIRPVNCAAVAKIEIPKEGKKRLLVEKHTERLFKIKSPFESVAFFNSPALRKLDLSSSQLKSCYIDLPNLRHLDLSRNRLSSQLQIKAPRLRILSISENKFARLLFTPLPHLSALDASSNQLIDIQNLSQIAPRLMFLNVADNFIDKLPPNMSSLIHLDITNNSLRNFDAFSSPFITFLRAQFNNFGKSDQLKVFPFLAKNDFLWADSPRETLPLNVKTKEDLNADFDHNRLITTVIHFDWTVKSLPLVDRTYWNLWHMRKYILQSSKLDEPIPVIKSFLKRVVSDRRKSKRETQAVQVIESWWASANVRLKIKRAREQIRASAKEEFKLEEFDVDSFYESLDVGQELESPRRHFPQHITSSTASTAHVQTSADVYARHPAKDPPMEKKPLLTYYDVEGNTHSVMNAYDSLVDDDKIRSQAQELFAWKQMGDAPNIYAESFKSSKASGPLPSIPETPKISKKEEKITQIMQSWNVGRETAERMYTSQNRMKGKTKSKKRDSPKKSFSSTNSLSFGQESNSMTSLVSARSRDRTWIKPKYQSDTQRAVVNNWVQKIDEGMPVTPVPHDPLPLRVQSIENNNSDHFSFAKSQLSPFSLRTSTPPLPPLKKKASHVPAWH